MFTRIAPAQIISDAGNEDEINIEFGDDSIYNDDNQDNQDNHAQTEAAQEAVIKGSYRVNFGVEGDDFIWKDANYLLQQGSWRYLYGEKCYNTYDRGVYNQFTLSIDSAIDEKLSFYTKIVIDPWSFTGKSQKITLPSWYAATDGNDPVEIQLKYWSNSGRTYPEIVRSAKGDYLSLPEIKVVKGKTQPAEARGEWDKDKYYYHHIDIPELEIDTEFKPIRALWFDYKEDEYRMVVFLYAQDNIAMYSDDPMHLVNNHIMWEPSPWLNKWNPGKLYTKTGWESGSWTNDLFLKDSPGNWLTLLRAVRWEGDFIGWHSDFMLATPLDPWDDYDQVNNIPLSLRLKNDLTENIMLGGVYAARSGFDQDSLDALDHVLGLDSEITINEFHALELEYAVSRTGHNLNNDTYKLHIDDEAYMIGLKTEADPFELEIKSRISYTCMGSDFYSPLSNYAYTRDDMSWGNHLYFHARTQEEENYRIGNSIDQNRKVFGWDINFGEFEGMNLHFNFRNVNQATDDSFLENIFRNEINYQSNEQMLLKFLVIYHNRDKTPDGKSQDTTTVSGGIKYDFFDWMSFEQIVERTNEYPGFPDGLYDWLTINPVPPYPYFYLGKSRLIFLINDWIELGFESTYNEFEYAATLDDFMNNSQIDVKFLFNDCFSARGVYRYSRVADYLNNGEVAGHHNFYFELACEYEDDSRLALQFSELGDYVEGLGWQSSVLDTQHIVRLVYEAKF